MIVELWSNPSFAENTAEEYYQQGCDYYEQEKFDEAAKAFKKAVELKPDNAIYHYNLGATYSNLGKYEESLKHLEKAKDLAPESQAGKYAKEQIEEIKKYLEKSIPAEKLVKEKEPIEIKAEEKVKFSGEKIRQEVKSPEKSAQSEVDPSKGPQMVTVKFDCEKSKIYYYYEDRTPFNNEEYVKCCLQEIYGPLIKKIEKQCFVERDAAVGKDCICADFLAQLEIRIKKTCSFSSLDAYIIPKFNHHKFLEYYGLESPIHENFSIYRIIKFIGGKKYVAEHDGRKSVLEVADKEKLLTNLSQLDNILESARNDYTAKVKYDSEVLDKFIKPKEAELELKNRQFIKKYLTENKKIKEINKNNLENLVGEKVKIHFNVIGTKIFTNYIFDYIFIFGYAGKKVRAHELITEGLDLTVTGILKTLQKDKFEIAECETTDDILKLMATKEERFSIIFKKEPLTDRSGDGLLKDIIGWGLLRVVEEENLDMKLFWQSRHRVSHKPSGIFVITEIEKVEK